MKRAAVVLFGVATCGMWRPVAAIVRLRHLRRRYPEMLDGAAALASVTACIAEDSPWSTSG